MPNLTMTEKKYWEARIRQILDEKTSVIPLEADRPDFRDDMCRLAWGRIVEEHDLRETFDEINDLNDQIKALEESRRELLRKAKSALEIRQNVDNWEDEDAFVDHLNQRRWDYVTKTYLPSKLDKSAQKEWENLGRRLLKIQRVRTSITDQIMLTTTPVKLKTFLVDFQEKTGLQLIDDLEILA